MLSKTMRWSSKVCLSQVTRRIYMRNILTCLLLNALLSQAWKSFATTCMRSKETLCWLPLWSARQTPWSFRRSGQLRQG